MFAIVAANWLAPDVKSFLIEAPRIAAKQQAGQFVIVRLHDHGERIPLTIADADPAHGTIRLIVQGIGKTTRLLNSLEAGDAIRDVVGPLGNPTEIRRYGNVAVVAGGVGAAIGLPSARALRAAGNYVVSIVGARQRELLILTDELTAASDELMVTTNDGSAGRAGLVTDALLAWIQAHGQLDLVLAIGPVAMMRGVAELTRAARVPTRVSLNSIMIDGTGMCGGCRVLVGGTARFACVDGPEFDAHQVDFDILERRNAMYREEEHRAWDAHVANSTADDRHVDQQCRLLTYAPEDDGRHAS